MFEKDLAGESLLDAPDMELPDIIPAWVLELPPLPDPPCDCCTESTAPREPARGWAVPGVTWGHAAPAARPALSPALLALQAAAERVCGLDPRNSSPEQALVDGEALLQVGQQLRVCEVRRLGDVRARDLFVLAGHRSTSSWLREQQPDADLSLAGVAGRLAGFGTLAASVETGDCSLGAAKRVAQALLRCRPHVDQPDGRIDEQPGAQVVTAVVRQVPPLVAGCLLGWSDDDPRFTALVAASEQIVTSAAGELDRLEAAFTMLAEQVPASMLAGCLEDLVLAVLPSVLEERGERGRCAAALSLQPKPDGTGWRLEGDLDLQCGERLFTALAAEVRRDKQGPADTEAAAQLRADGLDPYDEPSIGRPWPRSRRRVLHDAFDGLLGRYLESGCGGTSQKLPVQVGVTVEAASLEGLPRCATGRWRQRRPDPHRSVAPVVVRQHGHCLRSEQGRQGAARRPRRADPDGSGKTRGDDRAPRPMRR